MTATWEPWAAETPPKETGGRFHLRPEMEFKIDTHELNQMAARYAGAGPIVRDETKKGLEILTIMGQNAARGYAPVDTGVLRNSISHEVTVSGQDITGRFGTNVQYGRAVEYGTGVYAQDPTTANVYPPDAADLHGWGPRHGFDSDGQVAAIIRWKGGTKAHAYLRPALKEILPKISAVMDGVLTKVMARVGKTS